MTSKLLLPRRGLYAITPDITSTPELLARVKPVLIAGASVLQYRNKSATPARRVEQAGALRDLCSRHDVPLIINDDVALAIAVAADGVHLGADDGDLRAAREALRAGALIGASCYDDLQRARQASAAGASYVAFGAFFPSPTKPLARRADPQILRDAHALGLRCVAIGGITPLNARELVRAGADWLAVISSLFDVPDPARAARLYLEAFKDTDT